LRDQPTSTGARLKDVIRHRYGAQIPHPVREGFRRLKSCQAIRCRSRSSIQNPSEN
jgi:hypothetical protein